MSKLAQIERLLQGTSQGSERTTLPSFQQKDTAYISRLREEIQQTSQFITQADKALENFRFIEKRYEGDVGEKRRVVALYDAYGKLPFIADKDSVLGIATASIQTQQLVNQHKSLISILDNTKSTSELEELASISHDYQDLMTSAAKINSEGAAKLRELDTQIDQNRLKSGQLIEETRQMLEKKMGESSKMTSLLSLHLKRVLTKFIALQNWEKSVTLDPSTLKAAIKQIMVMLDKLLNASEDSWTEIEPTPITALLIKMLIMRNIVDSREDSTSELYYLKIRDFGID